MDTSYVYFIRKGGNDVFKVGVAVEPRSRLITLGTAHECPLFLCSPLPQMRA